MNKTDLIKVDAQEAEISKKAAEAAVNATFAAIAGALKAGDKVQIFGFGNFGVKDVAARVCRNPKTNETINVAASKKVSFSAAKGLKDQVNA